MKDICGNIQSYPENYWDFKGVSKEGIHKIGKYPATMVADMQYELVKIITEEIGKDIILLDPFCGSGTSLIISKEMGIPSIGIDINPYAVLLSRVKSRKYSKLSVIKSISNITERLKSEIEYEQHSFKNIEKWFREDIIDVLSKIRRCIKLEPSRKIREFLWACFSETVFEFSNDRTSTFKLHVMSAEKIALIKNDCINKFIAVMDKNLTLLDYTNGTHSRVIQGNCINKMSEMTKNSVSIICTSPPYGDNATTVTYGQFSILALKWMDENDLFNDNDLLENYSKIDRLSLGGTHKVESITKKIISLNKYITKLSDKKKKKVINFFEDYFSVFIELEKVLKPGGFLLMTVGNRCVDGVLQPLDKISVEIAKSLGFVIVTEFDRKISSKNMPLKVSNVLNKGAVNSMTEETVLIFRKREEERENERDY